MNLHLRLCDADPSCTARIQVVLGDGHRGGIRDPDSQLATPNTQLLRPSRNHTKGHSCKISTFVQLPMPLLGLTLRLLIDTVVEMRRTPATPLWNFGRCSSFETKRNDLILWGRHTLSTRSSRMSTKHNVEKTVD
jgi:hypothetical protein